MSAAAAALSVSLLYPLVLVSAQVSVRGGHFESCPGGLVLDNIQNIYFIHKRQSVPFRTDRNLHPPAPPPPRPPPSPAPTATGVCPLGVLYYIQ